MQNSENGEDMPSVSKIPPSENNSVESSFSIIDLSSQQKSTELSLEKKVDALIKKVDYIVETLKALSDDVLPNIATKINTKKYRNY